MNFDRIDNHFQRLMLIALVCHSFRDWGWAGPITVLMLGFFYAWYSEWMKAAP